MKIKVINLLNKIANGEEVPKRIKTGEVTWTWDGNEYMEDISPESYRRRLVITYIAADLNKEIEILEYYKEIGKIKIYGKEVEFGSVFKCLNEPSINERTISDFIETSIITINELVEEVNKLKNK